MKETNFPRLSKFYPKWNVGWLCVCVSERLAKTTDEEQKKKKKKNW